MHFLHKIYTTNTEENNSIGCTGYDTKRSDGKAPILENAESPFINISPKSILPEVEVPVMLASAAQIEQFYHLQYFKPFNYVKTNDYW